VPRDDRSSSTIDCRRRRSRDAAKGCVLFAFEVDNAPTDGAATMVRRRRRRRRKRRTRGNPTDAFGDARLLDGIML
jgi:hypothetical protein